MESFLRELDLTEKQLDTEIHISVENFNRWIEIYSWLCNANVNYEAAFFRVMNVSSDTPKKDRIKAFVAFSVHDKYKKLINEVLGTMTCKNQDSDFKAKMGYSRKHQTALQRYFSDFCSEKQNVNTRKAELQVEIEGIQAKIDEKEQLLKEKWKLAYEFRGLPRRVCDENEEKWFEQWIRMNAEARAASTDYQCFCIGRAREDLHHAQKAFLNREDVKSILEQYYQEMEAALEKEIARVSAFHLGH